MTAPEEACSCALELPASRREGARLEPVAAPASTRGSGDSHSSAARRSSELRVGSMGDSRPVPQRTQSGVGERWGTGVARSSWGPRGSERPAARLGKRPKAGSLGWGRGGALPPRTALSREGSSEGPAPGPPSRPPRPCAARRFEVGQDTSRVLARRDSAPWGGLRSLAGDRSRRAPGSGQSQTPQRVEPSLANHRDVFPFSDRSRKGLVLHSRVLWGGPTQVPAAFGNRRLSRP